MTLSTHVLDTTLGLPAAGVVVSLTQDDRTLFEGETDADGRCPAIRLLSLAPGTYRLVFAMADYFSGQGMLLSEPPFLDRVAIDFGIADVAAHYHVPLLVSPYGYSTYRGS